MYVKRLEVRNLRSLAHTSLDFNAPPAPHIRYPNVNVLLGGNGLGKTSVLRAAALSALGPLLSSSSGFVSEGMIRRPPGLKTQSTAAVARLPPAEIEAEIVLDPQELPAYGKMLAHANTLRMRTTIASLGSAERLQWHCLPQGTAETVEKLQFDDKAAAFFMVGYGATRRVEASVRVDESARIKSRLRRYERVASLFEDHLGLMPLSYWLPDFAQRNKGRYVQVVGLMNDLLPQTCRMQPAAVKTPTGVEHLFDMNGVLLPFRALSDGYRAYVGWIGDMLFHVCMGAGTGVRLREVKGVVLLDEIDLHLHPEWQRTVMPTLARTLPNIQFIVTTHSPLVVGSLEAANLFVLSEQDGATVVERLPERVHGRSAEQILLSPYFGLESTRAPEVSSELSRLANRAAQGDAGASMKYLELLSGGGSAAQPDAPSGNHAAAAERRPAAARAAKARARAPSSR